MALDLAARLLRTSGCDHKAVRLLTLIQLTTPSNFIAYDVVFTTMQKALAVVMQKIATFHHRVEQFKAVDCSSETPRRAQNTHR